MTQVPAISTRGLGKRYGGRAVVEALDLEVPPGSVFGFLGVNGAGKSTTMRMLTGLVWPDGGEARLLGEPITPRRNRVLARVGVLVEAPAFYLDLSGRRNLELLAALSGGASRAEVDAALSRVGLSERAGDKVRTYSHGMRQRLGIAQALLPRPELLILDEPSDGLDPAGMRDMRALVRSLASQLGLTIFLSSHLLAEVQSVCDQVAVLHEGRLRFQGTVSSLRERFAAARAIAVEVDRPEAAAALLRSLPGVEGVSVEGGELSVSAGHASAAQIASALVGAGFQLRRLVPRDLSLEEAFFGLLGDVRGDP